MDYEKKQRLIALRDSMKEYGYADGVEELESIFPELTESEDERVRKWAINFLHSLHYKNTNDRMMALKAVEYLERQKEQKPSDGSEEDEKRLEDAIKIVDEPQKPIEYAHEMWKNCEANFEGGKKEVINNPEKYGLQKPIEWSEEDKKAFSAIEEAIGSYHSSNYACELVDWLKSLRPQPKEQDVEKYPEDKSFEAEWKEYYNNSLVSRLPMNKREVARHFYWFAKKNAWKPSEEQMGALAKAVTFFKTKWTGAKVKEQLALESLYEDLKKL